MAGEQGFLDWRGRPISKKRHGGTRAALFIYFMVVTTSMSNVPNMMNIVTYLQQKMHTDVASSLTIVTNFMGTTSAFALLGGFLSDSYINRFKTILIFMPIEFLGFVFLAVQAHFPSLRPPPCATSGTMTNCERFHGSSAIFLYIGLYTIALGEGCTRAALASFGGDQFDDEDPTEKKQKSSFFNWFAFGISFGVFSGLILVVWVENNVGWDYGFGLSALIILLGLVVIASGFSFFRNLKPRGSPLTRMLQVFVVAFTKRKLVLPENEDALSKEKMEEAAKHVAEVLPQTKDFRFLDRATIFDGRTGDWSLCNRTQVEETKIILRMLPVFLCSIFSYIPIPLLLSLTIQQGNTMNTRVGGTLHISPASLFIIPVIFQMIILVIYDRLFVPFARKITGYTGGITSLQRVGVGYISIILATCVAAGIERKRLKIAEDNDGLIDSGNTVPMSVFWLAVQFFVLGITDVTSFVGLLEFFTSEVSAGMKSIGAAIFWCVMGLSSLLGTFVVDVVNGATRHGEKRMGWLEGNNLNQSRLDLFYWLLAVLGLIGFVNYMFWARRYVYRQDPRINDFTCSPRNI